ncbi:MAG: transporter [Bacilli bacterium]|nr:transporter [Bacilli bacterium]
MAVDFRSMRKAMELESENLVRDRSPETKRRERAALVRGLKYLWPHRWKTASVLFTVVMTALLDLIPPLILKELIDHALPTRDGRLLGEMVLLMVIFPTISQSLRAWQQYANNYISFALTNDFRRDLYDRFMHLPMSYHVKNRSGEFMSRIMNDCQNVSGILQNQLPNLLNNTVKIITTIGIVFYLSPTLTLTAILVFSLYVIPSQIFGKKLKTLSRRTQEQRAKFMEFVRERLAASGLIRISATEALERKSFEERIGLLIGVQVRSATLNRLLGAWSGLINSLGTAAIYGVGGYMVYGGHLSIGVLAAFTAYLGALYQPIQMWSNLYVNVLQASVLLDRIFTAMDLPVEYLGVRAIKPAAETGRNGLLPAGTATREKKSNQTGSAGTRVYKGLIEFRDVDFRHEEDGPVVLDGLSFVSEPGEVIAFVGRSGAGKSTVLDLTLGLSRAQSGQILIDRKPLDELDISLWRKRAAIVSQDTLLWNDTILNNITYGAGKLDQNAVYSACRDAQLHDWILTLPEGYDTIVGTRGQQLSGGQRQRVSLARAFLREPDVLLLDEATSALDTETERLIMEAVRRRMTGRTVLIVAHRLSTVKAADRIYVVEGGKIVESGSHEKLLEKGGIYSSLYEREENASLLEDTIA